MRIGEAVPCSIYSCDRDAHTRGWCKMHYQRATRKVRPCANCGRPKRMERSRWCSIECSFWGRVNKTGPCWLWTGTTADNGYGHIRIEGKYNLVHRWVYENQVGPIPKGLVIDHLCRVRHCVNPDHLEPVTFTENVLRGVSLVAMRARQTHCIRGHEFTAENTALNKMGRRTCRECRRQKSRDTRRLIGIASRKLGLSKKAYIAIHGYSNQVALRILEEEASHAA